MIACCVAAMAQSVTLTFTAKDAANHYMQLNRVVITNLTKGWQETIYWPDTTLTMQNGTGINDDDLPFIFEKFYRGKNATGKNGTGLGLYIVKYMIEKMNGKVELESSDKGLLVKLFFKKIIS